MGTYLSTLGTGDFDNQGGNIRSKVNFRLTDKSSHIKTQRITLPQKIAAGPRTKDVIIHLANMNIKNVPMGLNYLYDPMEQPAKFDAINTLASCQMVINIFQQVLKEAGLEDGLVWRWGAGPISIWPWARESKTSMYSGKEGYAGGLSFGYHNTKDGMRFLCRSFHEIAHNIGELEIMITLTYFFFF